MFECSQCNKQFQKSATLRQHRHRNHRPKDKPVLEYSCGYCCLKTKYKYVLRRHIKAHLEGKLEKKNSNNSTSAQNFICNLCEEFECIERKSMVEHYQTVHKLQFEEQILNFKSDKEFTAWKQETEAKECCRFAMRLGKRTRNNTIVAYYVCFRDGRYKPEGTGKRRLKVIGSCRMGGVCPASMKVTRNVSSGAVHVKYIARHVGHTADVGRLNLTQEERNYIACKLAAGSPIGTIVDLFRESPIDGQLSRVHLTTRKDVWNIRNSLQLQNSRVRHSDPPVPSDREMSEKEPLVAQDDIDTIEELATDHQEGSKSGFEEMKKSVIADFVNMIESTNNYAQLEEIQKALQPVPDIIKALGAGLVSTR